MQKITRNTFEKGLNTDIESSKIEPVQYTDAHNVEIVGDGEFLSLKNIKGTEGVKSVTSAVNGEVIGMYENTYIINGTKKKCLTIFTVEDYSALSASSGTFLLSGNPTNFYTTGSRTMVASPGAFSLAGQNANETVAYAYIIKADGAPQTIGAACVLDLSGGGGLVYSDVGDLSQFSVGDTILYTTAYLSTPFTGLGAGTFYKIRKYTGVTTTYATQIDTDGKVLSLDSCS